MQFLLLGTAEFDWHGQPSGVRTRFKPKFKSPSVFFFYLSLAVLPL